MKTLYTGVAALMAVVVSASGAGAGPLLAWDTVINTPKRFKVLAGFNNEAVLDQETGLVWERSPDTTEYSYGAGHFRCNDQAVGNREGWRLPTVQELKSLVDRTQANPSLPSGHPFSNVQSDWYWSATHMALDPAGGSWVVNFGDGGSSTFGKTTTNFVWCVRSGYGGPELQ